MHRIEELKALQATNAANVDTRSYPQVFDHLTLFRPTSAASADDASAASCKLVADRIGQ